VVHSKIIIVLFFCFQTIFSRTHFVLISAPGSGKGTFSQYLVRKYGYVQICPGDIFREHIRAETSLGSRIKPIVERGEYIDEAIVFEVMSTKLTEALEAGHSLIIDGFPRTNDSFDFLERYFHDHAHDDTIIFLQFVVSDETCVERIANRLICPSCATVFSARSFSTDNDRICLYCADQLSMRLGDSADIARSRLAYFHEFIEPLLNRASEHYRVCKISTKCTYEELKNVYDALINA
jgi:adenylate kinase